MNATELPSHVPSIYALILSRMRQAPQETAVVTASENIPYRRFCSDIDKASRHIRDLGLEAGARVGVVMNGLYMHWVVTIALMRLGLLSATCLSGNLEVLAADVLLCDAPQKAGGARVVTVSREWITGDAQGAPVVDAPLPTGQPVRIVMSSGTTGMPKLAWFDARALDHRIRGLALAYGMSAKSRVLSLMGASTIGGMVWPLGCWAAGGAVLLTPPRDNRPLSYLLRNKPDILFASTSQLEALVEGLPADFAPQPGLTIFVAGSALPRAVSRRTRMRLTPMLIMVYGATEVGTATLAPASHVETRPGLTGYVVPPVVLEIVDEAGKSVPPGTLGEIRIRAPDQVGGYLDDEETTALTFRDGWFHPGDLGVLGNAGDLYVQGRVKELMNIGGMKLSPEAVDEVLAGVPGVKELAAFGAVVERRQRPCVAVVAEGELDESALVARCAAAYPLLPPLKVFRMDKLPRNEMGKVQRLALADALSRSSA